jgi:hypothetical protein
LLAAPAFIILRHVAQHPFALLKVEVS